MKQQPTDIHHKMMAGFLTLDNVTPTIRALFGPYIVQIKQLNNHSLYIKADSRIGLVPTWHDIHQHIEKQLNECYGISPEKEIPSSELLKLWDSYHNGKYEPANNKLKLPEIINLIDFNEAPDLTTLFLLAKHFNDGHGLNKVVAREYTLISDPIWGNNLLFHSIYASEQLLDRSGGDGNKRSEILDECLETNNFESAAQILLLEVESLLCSFIDDDKRAEVRKELCKLLTLSSALNPKYIN